MTVLRVLLILLPINVFANHATAGNCASIESWTGCYLDNYKEGCNAKVEKIDFTDFDGRTLSQWIEKSDMREQATLTAHVTAMMQNHSSVNVYFDTHCSDGPCLTGHEHLCKEYRVP